MQWIKVPPRTPVALFRGSQSLRPVKLDVCKGKRGKGRNGKRRNRDGQKTYWLSLFPLFLFPFTYIRAELVCTRLNRIFR